MWIFETGIEFLKMIECGQGIKKYSLGYESMDGWFKDDIL